MEKPTIDNTGYKLDGDKNKIELVPPDAVEALGRVMTYGASKYPAYNWARGMAWSRVYGALMRHMLAFWNGEELDPESGLPHVEHALCCAAFLVVYTKRNVGTDDRFPYPPPSAVDEAVERDRVAEAAAVYRALGAAAFDKLVGRVVRAAVEPAPPPGYTLDEVRDAIRTVLGGPLHYSTGEERAADVANYLLVLRAGK
jgi:hypothetical protein